jgi:hypothetical protein
MLRQPQRPLARKHRPLPLAPSLLTLTLHLPTGMTDQRAGLARAGRFSSDVSGSL